MLRIGTAGWMYNDWKGVVYPAGEKDPLVFMSFLLDVLEINATFYRPPTKPMARSWVRRVTHNSEFRFTLKASRVWTHKGTAGEDVSAYLNVCSIFQEENRFGGILFQFPWKFERTPENLNYLLHITEPFRNFPRIVEVRHRSFESQNFLRFLEENSLSLANIDQPIFGKDFRPSAHVTHTPAYLRMHGRNYRHWIRHDEPWQRYDYLYSEEELSSWKAHIDRLLNQSDDVYVILNNHYRGQAVANCFQLKRMFGQAAPDPPATLMFQFPDSFPGAEYPRS